MVLHLGSRSLECRVTGNGMIKVILVPGGPGLTVESLSILHKILPENEFTVISYNPSGVALNETAPFYKSLTAYAAELSDVIGILKIEKPFLFGHSFGCAIVQEFLVKYPSLALSGVIFCNTFSSGEELKNALIKRSQTLPDKFQDGYKAACEKNDGDEIDSLLAQYWYPSFVCRTSEFPNDVLMSTRFLRESAMYYYYLGHDILNISGAITNWNRFDNLSKILVPTLVMSGEFDYLNKIEIEKIINEIPKASLWYESDVSHFPMYEKTDLFKTALLDFLRFNNIKNS